MTGGQATKSAIALLVTLAVAGSAAARPHAQRVGVYFLRGEQLARVDRPGTTAAAALRALLSGPTSAERARGFRSYVPAGSRVLHVAVANGVATVDVSSRFATGNGRDTRLARLAQLVRTVAGSHPATPVLVLVAGRSSAGLFPGIDTSVPITFQALQTPDRPVPQPRREKLPPPDARVRAAQHRLVVLGYLLRGDDDGRFGPVTQNAIVAFQKWERLPRTGQLDGATTDRLATAVRPTARTHGGPGRRAEILLDRQVALLLENDRVVRTIAVSTGKASTPTPPGDYRVYAKIPRWWSTPFREWLPWALPFVGGIAFHQFADVPIFPASHGCVRQAVAVAQWTYDFASVGMPVKVLALS